VTEGNASRPRHAPAPPPDAPFFPILREYCLRFDGAYEDYPWGETVYKVGDRIFAFIGGRDDHRVTVKARPEDADVLVQRPGIERAAYIGRHGWVSILIDGEEALELALHLIGDSYDLVTRATRRRRR
jgi:predicted DNA-binding protein (MmcQ/YjbR family)